MGSNREQRRVLVVDDLPQMRALLSRVLTGQGYQADAASTLAEARGKDPASYDAVIVDARLGEDSGLDLVQELLTADPAAAGRCLVITGGPVRALPAGIASLAKPFKPADLVAAVQALPGLVAGGPGAAAAAPRLPAHAGPPAAGQGAAAGGAAGAAAPGWHLLAAGRQVRLRASSGLAGLLHDGPVQELAAATLELHLLRRQARPDQVPSLDSALERLDEAARSLRGLIEGPLQWAEIRLEDALRRRTTWLPPMNVTVDAGQPDSLASAEVPVVADIVELALLGLTPAGPPAAAHVSVRAHGQLLRIEVMVTPGPGGDDAGDRVVARRALEGLAAALGGAAETEAGGRPWRARLTVPRQGSRPP